ncbi:hypothetical protein MACJ_001426 [Theileria orientalis]|uniref:Uncharacterized protein n=1 Tax=Theileria orientalis TaxID=68886 RepID=A0A976QTQ7_THEOR|nr:hypothetical protein MACJ_001426 [Theileria orientalis]
MASLKSVLFIFLIMDVCKCTTEATDSINYRTVTLDVNPSSERRENVAVVKKRDETGVSRAFNKYVLFGTEKNEYFNVSSVVMGEEKVLVSGQELTLNYVYDAYTYWIGDQILVIAFRYYYSGASSYYKYYRRLGKDWKQVEGQEFEQNGYGHLTTENLTKLLNLVELENPKPPAPSPAKDDTKPPMSRTTMIIVLLVMGGLLILLLAGLAFYYLR